MSAIDSLKAHLRADEEMSWSEFQYQKMHNVPNFAEHKANIDAHIDYIHQYDGTRSFLRAERLLRALFFFRALASSGKPISLFIIQQGSHFVFGEFQNFRSEDAFAKNGDEIYKFYPLFEEDLRKKIERDNHEISCPIARSVCLYFDICFFHPFPDGNARVARLALDYVLFQNNLAPKSVIPLFSVSRTAGFSKGYLSYYRLLKSLCKTDV